MLRDITHEPTVLKSRILHLLKPSGPVKGFRHKIHANPNYDGLSMYCKYIITSGVVKLNKGHQNDWEAGIE